MAPSLTVASNAIGSSGIMGRQIVTRSPFLTPSFSSAEANRFTSLYRSVYVSLRFSPFSPSQWKAILSFLGPATCRSKALYDRLVFQFENHLPYGGWSISSNTGPSFAVQYS